ncbi:MAG: YxeA family protein [Enterococcus lacertideformus]|uniref:YxeA family protein n=1 Tax=Enterococcus lacertideformus TaxID=2771493 RepID=A0A931FB00_9ENTE|nr:YxeA family protein [Enterococcus lacertideformus]
MKVVKIIIGTVLFSGIALFGLKFYTQYSHDEFARIMDQLNPLVTKGEVYVKTKKPDEVNSYGVATYIQKAADKNGHERIIEFNGMTVLKESHYLKIKNKGAHVETYEEVDKTSVPKRALEIIG